MRVRVAEGEILRLLALYLEEAGFVQTMWSLERESGVAARRFGHGGGLGAPRPVDALVGAVRERQLEQTPQVLAPAPLLGADRVPAPSR